YSLIPGIAGEIPQTDLFNPEAGRNPPMGKHGKLPEKVLSAEADATIRLDELCFLLRRLGFDSRIRRSSLAIRRVRPPSKIDQQKDGSHAKPYQVRQVRAIILANRLHDSGGHDA